MCCQAAFTEHFLNCMCSLNSRSFREIVSASTQMQKIIIKKSGSELLGRCHWKQHAEYTMWKWQVVLCTVLFFTLSPGRLTAFFSPPNSFLSACCVDANWYYLFKNALLLIHNIVLLHNIDT